MKFFVEFPAATTEKEAIDILVTVSNLLSRRIDDKDIIRTMLVRRVHNLPQVTESIVTSASLPAGTTITVDCDKWASVSGFEITI